MLLKPLVQKVLERARHYEWTLQGFGMLRLYLNNVGRIHVWDSAYATADVSVIHDHAWDLQSQVVAGELTNIRYAVCGESEGKPYWCQNIATGEGGGPIGEPLACFLVREGFELLGDTRTRQSYAQASSEIHETRYVDGTVTLVARPEGAGRKTARSFYPFDFEWVSAEPRPATTEEVVNICESALAKWFPERL